ncbi:MAG: endonuclease III domain-containing protein [Candidatus Omnitrophica bacterium]|nr:endonuclease III domain-containing protein [Candidatus Omnitrophota bacterium]
MIKNKPQTHFIWNIYQNLYERFGPQFWWPADSEFEVIVGAVLTQNTNWKNVEKAIDNLKAADVLKLESLHAMPPGRLANYIKPAGYFNIKAKRLKNVVAFVMERFDGSLDKMRQQPLEVLRSQLLSVNGVGPETADSILLYALGKSVFVVDAYTKRFLIRHNWVAPQADYHQVQALFSGALKSDVKLFNEYHALIVRLAKEHCKTVPDCRECPLVDMNYDVFSRCGNCFRAITTENRKIDTLNNKFLCEACRSLK